MFNLFADSTLLTTATASVACMLIICAIFMRNIRLTLVAAAAILSMVIGFIGKALHRSWTVVK